MTELDDDLVPETLALIDEFGITATFAVDSGSFDPATSAWTPGVANVNRKVSPPGPKQVLVEGTRVEKTITYVAASGLSFTPTIGMQVTIDGRAFKLTEVTAIYSGALVCAYELRLD